jgi:hypothetical protein
MSDHPEVLISDNPHGIMFFGPGGRDDDGAQYTMATSSGSMVHYNKNGSKAEIVRTSSYEICGDDFVKDRKTLEKEAIAKAIIAENGDIVLNAQQGNIKLLAKNIWIEANGDGKNGVFYVNANGQIQISSSDQLVLSGSKVCIRGQAGIDLASDHFINVLGELKSGSPLSSLIGTFLPPPFADLLKGIHASCK